MSQRPKGALAATDFTVEQLMRAAAPVPSVIDALEGEEGLSGKGQASFATILRSLCQTKYGPPNHYQLGLIRNYISEAEAAGETVADDGLMQLLYELISLTRDDVYPDPLEPCYVSFDCENGIPCCEPENVANKWLSLRVFPRHNDLGLKLWEAGACLAEYFMTYPQHVRDKRVVELGAGVGLTALVAYGLCGCRSYHGTDYTEAGLENMLHNMEINEAWLTERRQLGGTGNAITVGFLEWEWYASGGDVHDADATALSQATLPKSVDALSEADVLVAADLTYDISGLPSLTRCVDRYLSQSPEKVAIFATTLRNRQTFDAFERLLKDELGIECSYQSDSVVSSLPQIFPLYHYQPRADIRICFLRKK